METVALTIEGMTCASCVRRVEKAISTFSGVSDVSVNLATERASFSYDKETTSLQDIAKVVEEAGYELILPQNTEVSENAPPTNHYEDELKKDLIISAAFSIPIFLISMLMMFDWFNHLVPLTHDTINKILFILTTFVIFIPGKRFYKIFWNNLKHFTADMNSLIAIGTGAAYIYSSLNVLFPELFSNLNKSHQVYFDSAAVIITLILFGRWLESKAKSRSGAEIQKLIMLQPQTATIKKDNQYISILISNLKIKDIVAVKPGEKIPADGIIIFGDTSIDESMITGESLPVEKNIGASVIGGTINKSGFIEFEVTSIGNESMLGKIIKFVEETQASKPPIQRLVDKIAEVFVPVVIGIAIITFIIWMFIPSENQFNIALVNFVAVLIIACPCALGLATPAAVLVGSGLGASNGILIKSGETLEKTKKISTIVFDKTGTLTVGKPKVIDFILSNHSELNYLQYAASLERKSEHPISTSIVELAKSRDVELVDVEQIKIHSGFGIEGIIEGNHIVIGNESLMNLNKIPLDDKINNGIIQNDGSSLVYLAVNNELAGIFIIKDPIKDSAMNAISKMKTMGIKTVMITGDRMQTAQSVASQLGIDEFVAEVLPENKAKIIAKYQEQGEIVAMVGDGINDAPALAKSDIAIAMGGGTDIAIETASIVIINDNLMNVVKAINLSNITLRAIKQNLFWAFIYNTIGIPLAAIGILNPMIAALAMSFSSVSVLTNSLRIRYKKL
ncbi:MAG TPA: cadmium-translocating P-type ATPase [Bacteroidetes bacterium]|nr:cadmium-translocating P-type ATPase [Bacteroidota bacterium]